MCCKTVSDYLNSILYVPSHERTSHVQKLRCHAGDKTLRTRCNLNLSEEQNHSGSYVYHYDKSIIEITETQNFYNKEDSLYRNGVLRIFVLWLLSYKSCKERLNFGVRSDPGPAWVLSTGGCHFVP
jgi:hypothetical protein